MSSYTFKVGDRVKFNTVASIYQAAETTYGTLIRYDNTGAPIKSFEGAAWVLERLDKTRCWIAPEDLQLITKSEELLYF